MFPLGILRAAPDVVDVEVDGRAGAQLDLADPLLLERLSIALHRHEAVNTRGALFRSLASGGTPDAVRRRAQALLNSADVRDALQLTLTNLDTATLAGRLQDVAATVYYAPDDEPVEEVEP